MCNGLFKILNFAILLSALSQPVLAQKRTIKDCDKIPAEQRDMRQACYEYVVSQDNKLRSKPIVLTAEEEQMQSIDLDHTHDPEDEIEPPADPGLYDKAVDFTSREIVERGANIYKGGKRVYHGLQGYAKGVEDYWAAQRKRRQEAYCPPAYEPKSLYEQAQRIKEDVRAVVSQNSQFKDDEDLDRYMCTFKKVKTKDIYKYVKNSKGKNVRVKETVVVKDYHLEYANKYKRSLDQLAQDFSVPDQALKCLIFRESQFDGAARSRTGAQGYGQFTGQTLKQMTKILSSYDKDSDYYDDLHEEVTDETRGAISAVKANSLSAMDNLIVRWKNFYDSSGSHRSHGWGDFPTYMTKERATNPQAGIPATAFYYFYLVLVGVQPDDPVQFLNSVENNALIAGIYNVGPAHSKNMMAHFKKFKVNPKLSPPEQQAAYEKWVDKLSLPGVTWTKIRELRGHMKAVSRCMRKDVDSGPPVGSGEQNPTMLGAQCA